MGVVYLAEDTLLGRQVAIKISTEASGLRRQQLRTRFQREIRAIAKLSHHQHIASVHDGGETPDGHLYIVMELVRGKTLGDLIQEGNLTLERTVEIIVDVAEALGEAHRKGIVHRDIKPSNIALNEKGDVKVLDFGLAKQFGAPSDDPTDPYVAELPNTQTREDLIVGTPGYFSPEQALGLPVDARSDIFSLGSVLYECLTGTPPFSGKSAADTRAKAIRDDPPPPSKSNSRVPAELDRIVLKALAKKPEARYQSAEDLIEALRASGESLSEQTGAGQMTAVGGRQRSSEKWRESKGGEGGGGRRRRVGKTTSKSILHQPSTKGTSDITVTSKPFISIRGSVLVVILISFAAFGLWYELRPKPYKPSAAAQKWYDIGTNDLREGAYFKAIKPLQQALAADDKFALAHARLAEVWTELDYTDKAKDELINLDPATTHSSLSSVDMARLQAIMNTIKRDFPKVVENYHSLVGMVADQDKAYAYVDLGRAYEKNQELDKATQSYQTAAKLEPNYAAAFLHLGITYGRSRRFAEADAAFDEAFKLFDISSDTDGIPEVLLQRGVLLVQQGKVNAAQAQLQEALKRASASENIAKQIKALLNLSNNTLLVGDADEAGKYSSQALELAKANGMENLTTAGLIEIGYRYLAKGNYNDAENYFSEALKWAQLYKGGRNQSRALLSLASLHAQQDDPDAALSFVERALPFYEQGGFAKETSQAYSIRGRALDQMGKYEEALQAHEQELKMAQHVNDPLQIASAHEGLGLVLSNLQKFPDALAHFEENYRINKGLGNKDNAGYASMNRGNMLWQLGRYEEARAALAEALETGNNAGHKPNNELLAWANLFSAQLALSERKFNEAADSSKKALALAGSALKPVAVRANSTFGLAQSFNGHPDSGLKYCERAVELARSMRDPMPFSVALLALAEADLDFGDSRAALTNASEAQTRFTSAKQYESEWRALAIQAQASSKLGDRQSSQLSASQAKTTLQTLEQEWDSEDYNRYVMRPDIRVALNQLE